MDMRFRETNAELLGVPGTRIVRLRNIGGEQLQMKFEKLSGERPIGDNSVEDLLEKSNTHRTLLKKVQSEIASFLLHLSQASSAFRAVTETLGGCFDPNLEQETSIKEDLKKLNTVLESLTDELTNTLSKPIDKQLEEFNALKPKVNAWRNNVRGLTYNALLDENGRQMCKSEPKLTQFGSTPNTHTTEKLADVLASELRTLNQRSQLACCEAWQNLLEVCLKENVSFIHLMHSQKNQLVELQSRLIQNLVKERATLNVPPIPACSITPTQFQDAMNGSRETMVGETTRLHVDKPARPLRAREIEALKELSSSSQDVTSNGRTDLFSTDSLGDGPEFFKSTGALENLGQLGCSQRSGGNDNRSEPYLISKAQSIWKKPFDAFDVPQRPERYQSRAKAPNTDRKTVTDQRIYNHVGRSNGINGPRVIAAPEMETREVIIREPVGKSGPTVKRPSHIIIQKLLPPSNELSYAWNRQIELRDVSTEPVTMKPAHSDNRSSRLTIIEHPSPSLERTRVELLTGTNQQQQQQSNHYPHRGSNESKTKSCEVVATYPYAAQDTDELSLRFNEMVRILPWPEGMENEIGWLYGERVRDGRRGIFPVNFTNYK